MSGNNAQICKIEDVFRLLKETVEKYARQLVIKIEHIREQLYYFHGIFLPCVRPLL